MPEPPNAKLKLAQEPKKQAPLFDGKGYSAAWLSEQRFPDLEYIVPGIIAEGYTLLVGSPKIGKSWLSLALALGASQGTKFLGHINVSQRPVLYLALEDGHRRMEKRMYQVTGNREWPEDLTIHHSVVPDRIIHDMSMWMYQNYTKERPPLIILDTLTKGLNVDLNAKNTYASEYKVGAELKSIPDEYPGSALVVVHHNRKSDSEDPMDQVSGSKGVTGAADTTIIFERSRMEESGTFHVFGRDIEDGKYSIVKDDTSDGLVWHLAAESLSESSMIAESAEGQTKYGDKRKDIMDFVWQHGPVTAKEVKDKFGPGSDVYLGRLLKAENIIKPTRGTYAAAIPRHDAG